MTPNMSHFAWIALGQLTKQPYQDGDLVTKSGRTELIELGLAERVPMYGVKHLMENRLTKAGLDLAARFHEAERGTDIMSEAITIGHVVAFGLGMPVGAFIFICLRAYSLTRNTGI